MSTPAEQEKKTFVSSRGFTLNLKPVSPHKLDAVRTSMDAIDVPTYEINSVGGIENHPLTAEIAKEKDRLLDWNTYLLKKQEYDKEMNKRMSELMVWDGVDIEVPDENSDWHKQCTRLHIKVPTDPIDRKMLYVYGEFVGTPEDMFNLISQVLSVSTQNEEVIQRMRDSFRANQERKANPPLREGQGQVELEKPNV